MRRISSGILVLAVSLMMTGMAFAIDIPDISTWTQNMGVGGGGPGRGDALIAPLYDVRPLIDARLPGVPGTVAQEQFTMFSIVNTDRSSAVIARLRFREWKRSRECLDIDIPLTTNDVWVGVVSRPAGGGGVVTTPTGGGERWVNASIDPLTSTFFAAALFPAEGFAFRTFDIEAEEPDKVSRCELGYIEIFGEERVGPPVTTAEPWRFPRVDPLVAPGRDVPDSLMGTVVLIRPAEAITHSYNMTALSDFAVNPAGIWSSTATAFPNFFNDVQGGPGNLGINPGVGGFNQLEAILSKRHIFLEYATGTDPTDPTQTPMSTSAVITFPTKHFHYDRTNNSAHAGGAGTALTVGLPPFTGIRETLNDHLVSPAISACLVGENVTFRVYDRKENTFAPGEPVSPPQDIPPGKLPWEVNVIGFYPQQRPPDPPFFRDNITVATASAAATFYTGYVDVDLAFPSLSGKDNIVFNFFLNLFASYNGVPAVGIQMTEFFNGAVNGYYGDTVPWRYGVDWFVTPIAPIPVL